MQPGNLFVADDICNIVICMVTLSGPIDKHFFAGAARSPAPFHYLLAILVNPGYFNESAVSAFCVSWYGLRLIILQGGIRMKKTCAAIFMTLMVVGGAAPAGGQSDPGDGPSIVSRWVGSTPQGPLSLTFNEDGTAKGSMMGGFPTTFNCRYRVDYAAKPMAFELYEFENDNEGASILPTSGNGGRGGQSGGDLHYMGIFKFVDENNIQIAGAFGSADNRPREFGEKPVQLVRR